MNNAPSICRKIVMSSPRADRGLAEIAEPEQKRIWRSCRRRRVAVNLTHLVHQAAEMIGDADEFGRSA
ncbi:hypothetical protein ACVJA9_007659 [Bradyrhizobium diazoefficiens]